MSIEDDARRYAWLKSKAWPEGYDGGYYVVYRLPNVEKDNLSTYKGRKPTSYANLDEAIDAAMKNETK